MNIYEYFVIKYSQKRKRTDSDIAKYFINKLKQNRTKEAKIIWWKNIRCLNSCLQVFHKKEKIILM